MPITRRCGRGCTWWPTSVPVRLNRYLASTGVASRRAAEEYIRAGRVTVNGALAELGTRVGGGDDVRVDGDPVSVQAEMVVLLHKPAGVVTTASDPHGRPTVIDLVPAPSAPVPGRPARPRDDRGAAPDQRRRPGRPADAPAPRGGEDLRGRPSAATRRRRCLRAARGCGARRRPDRPGERCALAGKGRVEITIHEGRNRQVRRMCAAIGHPVRALHRSRYAGLALGDLAPGRVAARSPTTRWRRCAVHDVVVVGAGLSGLTAAHRLAAGGRGRGRAGGLRPGRRAGVDAQPRRACRWRPGARRRCGQHGPARVWPHEVGARPAALGRRLGRPRPGAGRLARGGADVRPSDRGYCASVDELERLGAAPDPAADAVTRDGWLRAQGARRARAGGVRDDDLGHRLDGAAASDVTACAGGQERCPGRARRRLRAALPRGGGRIRRADRSPPGRRGCGCATGSRPCAPAAARSWSSRRARRP